MDDKPPNTDITKEEWKKLSEPSPWLDNTAVKLSPLLLGCGLLTYGFNYGYNKQVENFKKEEKDLQRRMVKKRKGIGSNSKLVEQKKINFNKYDPKFNVEDRARKLALKALGYSTVLTGAFFLGSIAVVGIYFNVTSLRQFSDKMVEIGPDAMGGPVQESIEKPLRRFRAWMENTFETPTHDEPLSKDSIFYDEKDEATYAKKDNIKKEK